MKEVEKRRGDKIKYTRKSDEEHKRMKNVGKRQRIKKKIAKK